MMHILQTVLMHFWHWVRHGYRDCCAPDSPFPCEWTRYDGQIRVVKHWIDD